ncbi:hypothetical protein ACLKA6_015884 [Drosophila palustris]
MAPLPAQPTAPLLAQPTSQASMQLLTLPTAQPMVRLRALPAARPPVQPAARPLAQRPRASRTSKLPIRPLTPTVITILDSDEEPARSRNYLTNSSGWRGRTSHQSLLWQDIHQSLLLRDLGISPCSGRTFIDPCCRGIQSTVLVLAGHPSILAAAGSRHQSLVWQDIQQSLLLRDLGISPCSGRTFIDPCCRGI